MDLVLATRRVDRHSIGDVKPIRVDKDGFKIWRGIWGYGDVILPYKDSTVPGGKRYEFRSIAELEKSAESMVGKPICMGKDHPENLSPETAVEHSKGTVLRSWVEGDKGLFEFISYSDELDEWIESGRSNLSAGYTTDYLIKPGEHDGQPFHGSQTNIHNNHALVCLTARAVKDGEPARITGDAADMDDETPERGDMLSEESIAVIEAMPDEDKATILAALKSYTEKDDKEGADMENESDDKGSAEEPEESVGSVEERLAKLEEMARGDAAAALSAPGTGAPLDPDAIIKQAREAAVQAANDRDVKATAVRRVVGDSGWVGTTEASQLAFVCKVLPEAKDLAEGHVKAQRFDALDDLFTVANNRVKINAERADAAEKAAFKHIENPYSRQRAGAASVQVPKGQGR